MKNLTKLCASLFLAPLLLSGACSKDELTGKSTTASSPAVEGTKEAAATTKEAVKEAAGDAKDAVKEAAADTKDAAVKAGAKVKEAALDAKAAVENGKTADVGANGQTDSTRAAVDNGEAIKGAKARSGKPMLQGRNAADLRTTRRVRKAIMSDHSLSSEARNVRVVTANGILSLRGPVKSDAERDNLGAKALRLAGKNRVENDLDVAAVN